MVTFEGALKVVQDYSEKSVPTGIAFGCGAFLAGHVVLFLVNGANPAAYGIAFGLGVTISIIAKRFFGKESMPFPLANQIIGAVGGYAITRLFFDIAMKEMLKTTAVIGIVGGAVFVVAHVIQEMGQRR